jgi:outer membrane protein assembly factor BamD
MPPAPVRFLLVLSLALSAATAAAGCGASAPTLSYGESARRDYDRAMDAYADGDCLTAEPLFQHVVREYGYSRYAALAELRVADCELAQQHYTEAIRRYRSFVRARPTHQHVDYANFQIAVCYYRQIPTDVFLTPPREERDQNPTRSALRVVRRFLRDYTESVHVEEARRVERDCLALLARHELYVAGFYLQRDRPLATVGRLEHMLTEYAGSGLDPDGLLLLGRTYLHMRERASARRAFDDLIERFPESVLVVQARRYLAEMEADPGMGSAIVPPAERSGEAGEAPEPSTEDPAEEVEPRRVVPPRDLEEEVTAPPEVETTPNEPVDPETPEENPATIPIEPEGDEDDEDVPAEVAPRS